MKVKHYLLGGLSSCLFWVILFGVGYYNTIPDSSWNMTWFVLLVLGGVIIAELLFLLAVTLIREKLGHTDMM